MATGSTAPVSDPVPATPAPPTRGGPPATAAVSLPELSEQATAAMAEVAALAPAFQRRRRRRWILTGAAVVVVGLVATIFVLRQAPSVSARSRMLADHLLGTTDVPPGWSRVPPSNSLASTARACLAQLPSGGSTRRVQAAGAFRSAGVVPYLSEQLEQYGPVEARARWNELLDLALHGCPSGVKASGRIAGSQSISVFVQPAMGDQSMAFTVPLSGGLTDTVFIARSRGYVVTVQVVSRGPVDPRLFHLATSAAMTKIVG